MRVHEFVDEGLGHSSYLIDLANGSAAVIDPPRFPIAHEELAEREGLHIDWTVDTHSHADYVTGSPGLAGRSGATFIAPEASRLETPRRAVIDDEHIALAPGLVLVAIATPGHTPDHHAYVLEEHGTPVALFSGGSLMVGAVGRTDLCGPALAEPLAHDMFHSLRRFDALPDGLPLYPTHGAGSFCSAPGSANRTSTLGIERTTNNLFSETGEDRFVEQLLAGFGTFPSYFARLPELNRLGPTRFDTIPRLTDLTPDDVDCAVADGAVVVDARPVHHFAIAHVPGSMSNTLRPVFTSWTGWLIDPGRPIVFLLDDDQSRDEAVRQCLDIGHEQFTGVLVGGISSWQATGRPVRTIDLVDANHLHRNIVDVRQSSEYAAGHVPGAVNVELGTVSTATLAPQRWTVMCGHGERAMTAASILAVRRYEVNVLDGGPDTWARATGRALELGPVAAEPVSADR